RSLAQLRPAARTKARGVAAFGRRAAAHRDRALPAAGPEAPDPRRANVRADPARSRAAIPHLARAAQGRPRAPLHQPKASRAACGPEQRLGHATAPHCKLSDNALISGHAASPMVRHGFIDRTQARAFVDRITKVYDVRKGKPDPEAVSLSGGNLQKYCVGREILREPRLLVVSQPTWGVDAGAT